MPIKPKRLQRHHSVHRLVQLCHHNVHIQRDLHFVRLHPIQIFPFLVIATLAHAVVVRFVLFIIKS